MNQITFGPAPPEDPKPQGLHYDPDNNVLWQRKGQHWLPPISLTGPGALPVHASAAPAEAWLEYVDFAAAALAVFSLLALAHFIGPWTEADYWFLLGLLLR